MILVQPNFTRLSWSMGLSLIQAFCPLGVALLISRCVEMLKSSTGKTNWKFRIFWHLVHQAAEVLKHQSTTIQ